MTRRYDTTAVPLQGAYVARQCPVRAQNDLLVPGTPVEPAPFQQRLFDQGNAFEAAVIAELLAGEPAVVVIEGGGLAAELATLAAMGSGAPLILNGRMSDEAGRRVGKPDMLVSAGDTRYRAVDIKWHMALDVARPRGKSAHALVSPLSSIRREGAADDMAFTARRLEGDLLQLAHYQRMLEALGFAATDGRYAGVIGTERRVVWYDLDAAVWRTPSLSETSKLRSTMERYDFEFDFRLDIIAVAQQSEVDPTVDLLVVPVRCSECPSCPWSAYCGPILETPPGDVSLLPRVGWSQWKAHHDRGVHNRADLAALDVRTAQLVAAKVDVAALIAAVANVDPTTPVLDLSSVWPDGEQLAQLQERGIATAADVLALDQATARYSNAGMTSLPEQIDLARAALGPALVYRRRGVDDVAVPRADVEVDIDMENTELGAYLWGALVTRRSDLRSEYVPFVTWETMTADIEPANSLTFWRWLTDLRTTAHAQGLTFAAYCWNAGAENQYLRRIGLAWDIADEVEEFIGSGDCIDLLKVWDSQLITGGPSGLKVVAPMVGFHWDVADPGGGASMVMYDRAVGVGADADEAKGWLIAYNRGDVTATFAIREWIDREGAEIAGVEALGARAAA